MRCKNTYVLVTRRARYAICFDCQKTDLEGEITDPEMKKLFDIPPELYEKSAFLRDIKVNYLRYKSLTERQIEAFKKAVEELTA